MSHDESTVLRRAAEVLERDGWCQGNMQTWDGRHCAIGAIYTAVNELWNETIHEAPVEATARWAKARIEAQLAVELHVPDGYVARWNDDPDRRMPDVVKLFGQVADEVEVQ